MIERNGVDGIPGFQVIDRGIDMGARMAVHMQVADQYRPASLWENDGGGSPGNETVAPESGRVISMILMAYSSSQPVLSDERHEPYATMVLLREPVPVPFEHDQFLENTISYRGDQPPPFSELLFERTRYFRCLRQ